MAEPDVEAAALKGVLEAATDLVVELSPDVLRLSAARLQNRAIDHYNQHWCGAQKHARASDRPEFLERLTVNYLRHACSHYENWLEDMKHAPGAKQARVIVRHKITYAIVTAFPHLEEAALKQQWGRS